MRYKIQLIIFFTTVFASISISAQTNFTLELRKADPVNEDSSYTNTKKIEIHTKFLTEAKKVNNASQQFYGYLFLYSDHLRSRNYVEASNFLLQAASISESSGNLSWQGAVHLRKAELAGKLSDNGKDASYHFQKAADYFTKAKDSLSMAICFEQLGSILSRNRNFDSAHYYYDLTFPLMAKFGNKGRRQILYNNFSILLIYEGRFQDALKYADSALNIAWENNDTYKAMLYYNNLGSLYAELGQYDKAIKIYKECVVKNKVYNYPDRLVQNYRSLYEGYELIEQYDSAIVYLNRFYLLRDSITEENENLKIAELETKYETKEKEIALETSKKELQSAEQLLQVRSILIFVLLIITIVLIYLWRVYSKNKKLEIERNQQALEELTQILLRKNELIVELEEQKSKKTLSEIVTDTESDDLSDFEANLFNQRILTNDDWSSFKKHFEKAYPGYLRRIRSMNPALSEAEERLFVFIKLNLKTKETSAILGISADSVKKARNRLRKRLELSEEIDLDTFISNF